MIKGIQILHNYGLKVEHFKEHIPELLLDNRKVEKFTKLPPKTKTAFTRLFNSMHKNSLVGKKTKKVADQEEDLFDPDREEEARQESDAEEEVEEIEVVGTDLTKKTKKGKKAGDGRKQAGKPKKAKKTG